MLLNDDDFLLLPLMLVGVDLNEPPPMFVFVPLLLPLIMTLDELRRLMNVANGDGLFLLGENEHEMVVLCPLNMMRSGRDEERLFLLAEVEGA